MLTDTSLNAVYPPANRPAGLKPGPSFPNPVRVAALSILILAWSLSCWGAAPNDAVGGKQPQGQFLRITRDAKQRGIALETAIVRYAPKTGTPRSVTVDLIAAVHIADMSYYQQLNREFEGYDAVLYELVAPAGTKIPKGGAEQSGSPVSALQKGLKNLLALEFQLDQIDYTRKNLVHADMSPEQFARSMRDRGESLWDLLARMLGYAMAKQGLGNGDVMEAQLLMALFDKNRALALKRIMAEEFEEMEGSLQALDGPNGSTLISQRNKTALDVLKKQMAAGKRKIAIFYGGGHMPDFQNRLRDQFGLAPVSTRWLVAWDLKGPQRPK